MSEIIPALHPVPVRHVPRRGAHERLSHQRAVTPVRLRDVAPAAVERVHLRAGKGEAVEWLTVGDDGLWMRAGGATAADVHPGTAALFAAYLAGVHEPELVNVSGIGLHLGCTPLVVGGPDGGSPADRGSDLDKAVMSRAMDDLAPAARDALLRFVERDVVVCGDDVLFRARPLAWIFAGTDAALKPFSEGRLSVPACRPDRVADCMAALREVRAARPNAELADFVAHVPSSLLGDADVAHFVHTAPAAVWAGVREVLQSVPAQTRSAAAPLMPLIALGSTWAVEPEAYADALRATSAAFDAIEATSEAVDRADRVPAGRCMTMAVRLVRNLAIPRSAEAAPPAPMDRDDAESLVGMGP